MTLHEIVKDWLTTHGYDGLAGDECGCALDTLMPCNCPHLIDCVPGRKVQCTPACAETEHDYTPGARHIEEA